MAYASLDNLHKLALPPKSFERKTEPEKLEALEVASSLADDSIGLSYPLPLTRWPASLRLHVAWVAAYILIGSRGHNPNTGSDPIRTQYKDALQYFAGIANKTISLRVDQTEPASAETPAVSSDELRGWGDER